MLVGAGGLYNATGLPFRVGIAPGGFTPPQPPGPGSGLRGFDGASWACNGGAAALDFQRTMELWITQYMDNMKQYE